MMQDKPLLFDRRALLVLIGSGAAALAGRASADDALPAMAVFRDPGCGCCHKWVEHRREGLLLPTDAGSSADAQGRAPTLREPRLLYDRVGGETGVRALVETFYDIVEFEPEGRELHLLHLRGHGVSHSRVEQLNFLSGFLGGPRLYVEKHGHSNVREMHAHVEIGASARDAWLNCMSIAIDRVGLSADVKTDLMVNFTRVAFMLKNRD